MSLRCSRANRRLLTVLGAVAAPDYYSRIGHPGSVNYGVVPMFREGRHPILHPSAIGREGEGADTASGAGEVPESAVRAPRPLSVARTRRSGGVDHDREPARASR